MEQWREYRLDEIGTIVGGATPSTKDQFNYEGDIPWITPKDLSNHCGRYIFNGERMLSKKGYDSCSCKMLPKGSILFSSRAPIGYVAIAGTNMCTNQGFKSIIPDSDVVDNRFLYYLMLNNKNKIENLGTGTTFKEVSGSVMKSYLVSIPSLDKQKSIASLLSSLDDKIELNRRINDNLEQQAQALFKSWFVDFEPFKDGEFVDSELGRIPKGLHIWPLEKLVRRIKSGDWGKDEQSGNYTKRTFCIRGADLPDIKEGQTGKMPIRYILEKNFLEKSLVEGNVVVEISGGSPKQSTGRIVLIDKLFIDHCDNSLICTNFCKSLEIETGYSLFFYLLWQYLYDKKVMFVYENGSNGLKNLNINDLLERESFVIPPMEIVSNFNRIVSNILTMKQANGIENSYLSTLRDTLLPKLMSGELTPADIPTT